MKLQNYSSLLQTLKHVSHPFSLSYLWIGKEKEEIREGIQFLISTLIPDERTKNLSVSRLDASKDQEKTIFETIEASTFMVKQRILCLDQIDKMEKKGLEKLELYLKRPDPRLTLILISSSSPTKLQNLKNQIDQNGILIELPEVKPWERERVLSDWVGKQAAQAKKQMAYNVCQTFVKLVGTEREGLTQELDKLFTFCLDKSEITTQDVYSICSEGQPDTIWQLRDALLAKQAADSLKLARKLFGSGDPLIVLLRSLRSQFQTGYELALQISQGKSTLELAKEFPTLKGQILDRNIQQVKNFGLESFRRAILLIDQTELSSKKGEPNERLLLELLMIKLTSSTL